MRCIFIKLSLGCALALPSLLSAGEFVCASGYNSNLRSLPSTGAKVVAKLGKFTPVTIIEKKKAWTRVKSVNTEGWIYNKLLDPSIRCVLSLKSQKTHQSYTSEDSHKYRKKVYKGEGFRIVKTKLGMTQVRDKSGNVFWLENHILWPQDGLESLSI